MGIEYADVDKKKGVMCASSDELLSGKNVC
jgi:hypothetical protein